MRYKLSYPSSSNTWFWCISFWGQEPRLKLHFFIRNTLAHCCKGGSSFPHAFIFWSSLNMSRTYLALYAYSCIVAPPPPCLHVLVRNGKGLCREFTKSILAKKNSKPCTSYWIFCFRNFFTPFVEWKNFLPKLQFWTIRIFCQCCFNTFRTGWVSLMQFELIAIKVKFLCVMANFRHKVTVLLERLLFFVWSINRILVRKQRFFMLIGNNWISQAGFSNYSSSN